MQRNSRWSSILLLLASSSSQPTRFGRRLSSPAASWGTVADPNGAMVPGAKITLKNVDTGVE